MKPEQQNMTTQLQSWKAKAFLSPDFDTQVLAGWYDWFCGDSQLVHKTNKLYSRLEQIAGSSKFDPDKTYVWFKNNCPCEGELYDDFRIADLTTGDVLYTVVPHTGFEYARNEYIDGLRSGLSEVWGKENDFVEPLLTGTWKEVVHFFKGE